MKEKIIRRIENGNPKKDKRGWFLYSQPIFNQFLCKILTVGWQRMLSPPIFLFFFKLLLYCYRELFDLVVYRAFFDFCIGWAVIIFFFLIRDRKLSLSQLFLVNYPGIWKLKLSVTGLQLELYSSICRLDFILVMTHIPN